MIYIEENIDEDLTQQILSTLFLNHSKSRISLSTVDLSCKALTRGISTREKKTIFKSSSVYMNKGIVVAATHHLEWILPWWWMNYRAHNDWPVAFFDLGMTEKAKRWCAERGQLLSMTLSDGLVFEKEAVDPVLAKKWEQVIGSGVWDIRKHWFKKPFVLTRSPFVQSIWIDLDCEVRCCLSPLFSYSENGAKVAVAREAEPFQIGWQALGFSLPGEINYNTAVVVYHHQAPILDKWVHEVITRHHLYMSDQEALSRILFLEQLAFYELSAEYNWDRGLGPNSDARIFHWHGQKGKEMIKEQITALTSLKLVAGIEALL